MAKLSVDEFNKKYSEKIIDNDDLLIELMEDASDSISPDESEELASIRAELEKAKADFLDLKEKYKQRFLTAIETEEITEEIVPEESDVEEKEVIDIKEI